jgi:ubiquinone biosynthesis monooxygenase Coq7
MKKNKKKIEEIIRVNHAGEFGAKRIYQGQLSVLKGNKEIEHMLEQELHHLDYFENEIKNRKVRPTILSPIWNIAGFALGALTARLGEKAAMACTVAVEEVIGEHYQEQLDELKNTPQEKELRKKIAKFRDEELEHRDKGIEMDAKNAPAYPLLTGFIKIASKTAIMLSKKY